MTAFPGLAWQYADFTGGAMLTKVARPLADAGLAPQQVVMAVGDQRVFDVARTGAAARGVDASAGNLTLTVKAGDLPARVIEVRQ